MSNRPHVSFGQYPNGAIHVTTRTATGAVTPGICGAPLPRDPIDRMIPIGPLVEVDDEGIRAKVLCPYCRDAALGKFPSRVFAAARILGVEPWHIDPIQTWLVEDYGDGRSELVNDTWYDGKRRAFIAESDRRGLDLE